MQDTDLIGMTLEEARDNLNGPVRACKIDGEYLAVTCDYDPTRVNVEIENNHIVKVLNRG